MPHKTTKLASAPTETQELLLKAALLKDDPCTKAWAAWKNRINIEKLDHGSNRLLPLVYHNLFRHDVCDSLMLRLKSVYRHTLTKNHLMFHNIMPILRAFKKRDIETMLLKGAALTIMNYKNYGLRPQSDIDILVHNDQAQHAFLYLLEAGWKPEFLYPVKKILRFRHSCGFNDGAHRRIDLHWNIFEECRTNNADDIFWHRSVPVQLKDIPTRVLAPEDQFLHTCVHGIKWNTIPSMRWIPDAMVIASTPDQPINWGALITQSRERHLTLSMLAAMHYLKETFDAPIPDDILKEIERTAVSKHESHEFQIMTGQKSKIFGNFFKFTCGYRRLPRPKNFLCHLLAYPQFMQIQWKIKNIFLMPFQLIADSIKSNLKRKTMQAHGGH